MPLMDDNAVFTAVIGKMPFYSSSDYSILTAEVMGRDYDAAVMTAGFCGFMVGITPNAMASMEALTEKYAPAPRRVAGRPLGRRLSH